MAQPEVEDRELLLEIGAEQHDGGGGGGLVDRRPGQLQQLGRQAVGELGVAVRDVEGVGEPGPGEGVLVGAARAAEHGDAGRSAGPEGVGDELRRRGHGDVPRHRGQPALAAHERRAEAVVGAHGLEVEPAPIAHPAPVDRIGVDAEVPHELVAARLHDGAAADRAGRARALDLFEVPRPRLEPVRRRRQRADRADLHGVAREVRGERLVGERQHLRRVAAVGEADQRITGHLVGEARAPVAQDAALPVEQDEIADRDRLLEVALLLDVPALPRAVAERLVLQRALAALVADGTVERVVGEQQLEDALLGALGRRPTRCRPSCPGQR